MSILNVPQGTQAFSYDCGIKSLQLMMAYYGVEVPYHNLLRTMKRYKRFGLPKEVMANIARGYGFKVISKTGCSLKEVQENLEEGHPTIVAIQAWADHKLGQEELKRSGIGGCKEDWGHYVVVVGLEDGKVILNDPLSFRRVWLTEEDLLNRWHAANEFNFALSLRGKLPADKEMVHIDSWH
jgi:ABC-type bacteriocin/lantibiotic exporter with double-glycine peptidase domain